jgi:hypothetical protein
MLYAADADARSQIYPTELLFDCDQLRLLDRWRVSRCYKLLDREVRLRARSIRRRYKMLNVYTLAMEPAGRRDVQLSGSHGIRIEFTVNPSSDVRCWRAI